MLIESIENKTTLLLLADMILYISKLFTEM